MNSFSSFEIRQKFLTFFERHQHRIVLSSSLVPQGDPTLLFTNAGMNQFKKVFTGQESREYQRAVSSQKCVRAGGKHNDLENVGRTHRHHTFFEMLGNFSFGDYFKKEAIFLAWEFVTKELGLSTDRLYVSVFQDDEEAFRLWKDHIGIEEKRIFRFGVKDNFWSMGETGPCGPCSEIFYDQGASIGCHKHQCQVGCDCDRFVEFWNLVFMEFEQNADGSRVKLPKPSIDTGMGLERVTAISQGVCSNFETDLFQPIFAELGRILSSSYEKSQEEARTSMRVVADHLRAMTFLIGDGILPSNEGRGYVLRRIMRRAMRHGRKLGLEKSFLAKLSCCVVRLMGEPYPELKRQAPLIEETIRQEEERFSLTIDRGLSLLQEEIRKIKDRKEKIFSGEVAFHLYDTYGFPLDLTQDVLREHGLGVNQVEFDEAFETHREKARGSWKGSSHPMMEGFVSKLVSSHFQTEFLGYDQLISEAKICFLLKGGKEVSQAQEGDEIELVSDRTPFYGESGGQIGDIGFISGEGFTVEVVDTKKPSPGIWVHEGLVREGKIQVGKMAQFSVDAKARMATARNHTATHMLHSALREVLGNHVSQKGSLVSPERLRFDFTHSASLTPTQLNQIEKKINEEVWENSSVAKEILPLEKALQSGATALFDEKYGAMVRVISIADYSKEFCGGTHVHRTGEIGIFKIVKEGSVASGIRRVEAYTGTRALRFFFELEDQMRKMASSFGSSIEEVPSRMEKLLAQQKEWKKKGSLGTSSGEVKIEEVKGVRLVVVEVPDASPKGLKEIADRELEKIKTGVVVVGTVHEGRASLVVKVSKDLSQKYPANQLIQKATSLLGGSGGGRPEMAQAGGPNHEKLSEALASIKESF